MNDKLFPSQGDGNSECLICNGKGVTYRMVDIGGGRMWPSRTIPCDCVYERNLKNNVKRIWPCLMTTVPIDHSPLLKATTKNLWITASQRDFRSHMRYVAFRMSPNWGCKVVTDSKIITSWLASATDIGDPDVNLEKASNSLQYTTIEDLAIPPELLVIILGVKAAKNREMPNVLLEAIQERDIRGKATWVVDSPHNPLRQGHICYSEGVAEILDTFYKANLKSQEGSQTRILEGSSISTPEEKKTKDATARYKRRKKNQEPASAGLGHVTQAVPVAPKTNAGLLNGMLDLGVNEAPTPQEPAYIEEARRIASKPRPKSKKRFRDHYNKTNK